MLVEILDNFMAQNITIFLVLCGIFVFVLGEYFVVWFAKNKQRRESIIEFTIIAKILSFGIAIIILIATIVVIGLLALLLDIILIYYVKVLMTLGIVSLIVGFFC